MEKRAVLFLIISLFIILVYPYLLKKMGIYKTPPPVPKTERMPPPDLFVGDKPPIDLSEQVTALIKDVTVETSLYRATLSTQGGTITGWELKTYKEDITPLANPINLFSPSSEKRFPLSILTGDAARDAALQQGIYYVEGDDLKLTPGRPTGEITFIFDDPETGGYIAKRMKFYHDSYRVDVELDVRGIPQPYWLSLGTNFGIIDWGQKGFIGFIGPITRVGEDLRKDKPAKMEETVRHDGNPTWTALQDKYFIATLISERAEAAVIQKGHEEAITANLEFAPGTRHTVRLYAGPKEFDRLSVLGVGLEESIDFGWFMFGSWSFVRFFAEPLFHILRFFYGYMHNYGFAIILLTIGIRGLFIPLMHKSYKSMKAMQTLQPKVAALQKKLKNDKERLNRELMELYKKHGANPLGGCLPMLVQIPVFIALFDVLNAAIELRQAPFILWVKDLSSKDPYYVLPIIMGITMLLQQKMQPAAMDPRQAKIFMFMPVFFTFLFLNFPSGLVLYWLTNNVLTILQQYITKRYFEKPA